ncbi:c-SKI smad4 binding domain-containing protein [Ditylenchus destructor]|uniref:C-SKI smad4 binding domain-containing protein n=1 Tax=Ditylenchus destructor TaxID=166010 RepID=A0AAD4QY02_9BILA|nr:c-SKI smad4 binding domain-containing protein [Ditylenchus destructor]
MSAHPFLWSFYLSFSNLLNPTFEARGIQAHLCSSLRQVRMFPPNLALRPSKPTRFLKGCWAWPVHFVDIRDPFRLYFHSSVSSKSCSRVAFLQPSLIWACHQSRAEKDPRKRPNRGRRRAMAMKRHKVQRVVLSRHLPVAFLGRRQRVVCDFQDGCAKRRITCRFRLFRVRRWSGRFWNVAQGEQDMVLASLKEYQTDAYSMELSMEESEKMPFNFGTSRTVKKDNAAPPFMLQADSKFSSLKSTRLLNQLIHCFVVGGECRLVFPQMIACILGDIPQRSIDETKSNAERLMAVFLVDGTAPPLTDEAEEGIEFIHESCTILCLPSRALIPESFCRHSHVDLSSKKQSHWGFDSSNWPFYLHLDSDVTETRPDASDCFINFVQTYRQHIEDNSGS